MNSLKPDSSRRAVAVFRWMLGLYPDVFRREYEEKLILLFRDQLRDAKARCAMGDLLRFWVRMIVDTGFSAGRERCSELRRTLGSGSPAALLIHVLPSAQRRVFVMLFCTSLVSLGVWWATPPTYISTAHLAFPMKDGAFDPYEVQTEIEKVSGRQTLEYVSKLIRSESEAGKVSANTLNLTRLPGDTKYGMGTLHEDLERMQRHLTVRSLRNTSILEIQFTAGNPTEAAAMANRIATGYEKRLNEEAGPKVEIIDLAIPAIRPIGPSLFTSLLVALISGFGCAGLLELLAVWVRRSESSVRTV